MGQHGCEELAVRADLVVLSCSSGLLGDQGGFQVYAMPAVGGVGAGAGKGSEEHTYADLAVLAPRCVLLAARFEIHDHMHTA
jgi:hypothetical protein